MQKQTTNAIGVWSACVMLTIGSGLAIAGFIVSPVGQIHDSVLYIFAQILIYAGSIFGIGTYINGKFKELKQKDHDTNN